MASAVRQALDVAKEVLAEAGARAVRLDSRQLAALVRHVNAHAAHPGLLDAHLVGAAPDEVARRIAIVATLPRMDGELFGESAAARAGRSGLAEELSQLPPEERVRELIGTHDLSWEDLGAILRGAPEELAEAEQTAVAHLVPVGLAAARRDAGLAAEVAEQLRARAGVEVTTEDVLGGGSGELLRLVTLRAPIVTTSPPALPMAAGPPATPAGDAEPEDAWLAAESSTADEAVEVPWTMSPQAVLRVFLREAPGVEPPNGPGALHALKDGFRLERCTPEGDGIDSLDPAETGKVLHCGDRVRVVPSSPPPC